MKQLTQRLCDGRLEVLDLPIPQPGESQTRRFGFIAAASRFA